MIKFKYLCINVILVMVVAFAGHASVAPLSLQKGNWPTDDALYHHASEAAAVSRT
ncbi:hypothetical protein [Yoonia algicola]|uniref:Uncharacterized protein n=1 Tax=Yoonia algicola TaxID=3137368 RepID=A0AAN0M6Z6_9RHOB